MDTICKCTKNSKGELDCPTTFNEKLCKLILPNRNIMKYLLILIIILFVVFCYCQYFNNTVEIPVISTNSFGKFSY